MYKDILRSIVGIDVFPVVSLIIFLTVFTAAVVYAIRLDRVRLGALAALPLDEPDALAIATSHPVESQETRR
jgi:cytochrome c oxidase cbb3-type subunit IV